MSTDEETQAGVPPAKEDFIRRALADVEKTQRFQRVRQIILTILAFAFAFWLAFKPSGPELQIECTVIIMLGLVAGVCTAKVMSLNNRNTKAILQAIAELHNKTY